jgi:hypothetical protein
MFLFGLPLVAYSQKYVGVKKCKTCHLKIYKQWKESPHATAFDVLSPGNNAESKQQAGLDPQKDYTADPGCIECHTTGNNAKFPGIQCESCHGPGKAFTKITIMNKKKFKADPEKQRQLALGAGLVIKPDIENCKQCHNEKSPTYKPFDFEERYKEIEHSKNEG